MQCTSCLRTYFMCTWQDPIQYIVFEILIHIHLTHIHRLIQLQYCGVVKSGKCYDPTIQKLLSTYWQFTTHVTHNRCWTAELSWGHLSVLHTQSVCLCIWWTSILSVNPMAAGVQTNNFLCTSSKNNMAHTMHTQSLDMCNFQLLSPYVCTCVDYSWDHALSAHGIRVQLGGHLGWTLTNPRDISMPQ